MNDAYDNGSYAHVIFLVLRTSKSETLGGTSEADKVLYKMVTTIT